VERAREENIRGKGERNVKEER